MNAPNYDELAELLSAAQMELSAAEAHGLITGATSFPDPPSITHVLFGEEGTAGTPAEERLIELARSIEEDVRRRLEDTDFEFEPLLGEADLPLLVDRLAAWSRGYVLGLATGGLRDPEQLHGDAAEFFLDAMRIGEAEMDEDDDIEQQERELAEIIEYLRVGVQLVYEDLRGESAGPPNEDV